MEINKKIKINFFKISLLLLITLLVSATLNHDSWFLQLDKSQFKKDEVITGKACINTEEMKALLNKKDLGYGTNVYDEYYESESFFNAVELRIISAEKNQNSIDEYLVIKNALMIKNDTAFLSFKIPQSLITVDATQMMEIKVARHWIVRGRDTSIFVVKQFEIVK